MKSLIGYLTEGKAMRVTKNMFFAFETILYSGKYSMHRDGKKISDILGIDLTTYERLLQNEDKYKAKWPDVFTEVEKNFWGNIGKGLK